MYTTTCDASRVWYYLNQILDITQMKLDKNRMMYISDK